MAAAIAVDVPPRECLGAFAAHREQWGTFALPLFFGIFLPAVLLCVQITVTPCDVAPSAAALRDAEKLKVKKNN